MKKLFIGLGILSINASFAMTTIDLMALNYTCNGVRVTPQTTIAALQMNCNKAKVILHEEPSAPSEVRIPGGGAEMTMIDTPSPDDETLMDTVEFYTDKGSYMKCYYSNNKFVKCKRTPPKNMPVQSKATSSTVSKANSSKPIASAVISK